MKRIFQMIAVFALPAFLAACPDKNRDDNQNSTAATPLTTSCLSGQTACTPSLYGQFPGFFPYPVNYNQYGGYMNYWQYSYGGYYNQFAARFCDCGPNAMPVYNNQMGLGCIRNQALAPIAGLAGVWSLSAVNSHWTSLPQHSNLTTQNQMSCLNGVTQACFLGRGNADCASGQVCRSVAHGSALGICSRQ
ncbi:MAG: hypothetical protein KF789_02295 [Bdellovibrionaceae bacterium]|nr:hypothetical protein [Pseudobdellovibrionaceae bacterium]